MIHSGGSGSSHVDAMVRRICTSLSGGFVGIADDAVVGKEGTGYVRAGKTPTMCTASYEDKQTWVVPTRILCRLRTPCLLRFHEPAPDFLLEQKSIYCTTWSTINSIERRQEYFYWQHINGFFSHISLVLAISVLRTAVIRRPPPVNNSVEKP